MKQRAIAAWMAVALCGCQQQAPSQTPPPANSEMPENFMAGPKVEPPAQPTVAPQPPAEPTSEWSYSESEDPMTGKVTRSAVIASSNTLNFGFPYNGSQYGTLAIRKHPSYGNDVILSIEKGQILCHSYSGDCPVKIRFDDGKAFTVTGSSAADNSSEVVFLPGFKSLTAKIAKAKVMRIQFNVYHEGAPVLSFNVAGYDPERLK